MNGSISYKNFSQETLENNVKNIYDLANRSEHSEGIVWYHIANRFAQTIANKHDLTLVQTAAILAALSPATHWTQNIIDTEALIINGLEATVSTYHRNKIKASLFLPLKCSITILKVWFLIFSKTSESEIVSFPSGFGSRSK